MRRDVCVHLRRGLFSSRAAIYDLTVDGKVVASRLRPFSESEIEAVTRIGPPLDPLAIAAEPPKGLR